jgi:hypothetical protein
MKTLGVLALVLFTATGWPTLGTTQSNASSPSFFASPVQRSVSPFPSHQTVTPFASQQPQLGPRMIMPATGGAPILSTPIGGNLYLPVTGGPPVVGLP